MCPSHLYINPLVPATSKETILDRLHFAAWNETCARCWHTQKLSTSNAVCREAAGFCSISQFVFWFSLVDLRSLEQAVLF